MIPLNKYFCFNCLFLLVSHSFCQDIFIDKKHENISIQSDSSFVRTVSVNFPESETPIIYPIFYDTKLERVSDIKLYNKKGRKYKEVDRVMVEEEELTLDYIASKSVKTVFIPSGSETMLSYTIECPELMYFSSLALFSNKNIDSLSFEIHVPETFTFLHNTIHQDSLKYIKIDSLSHNSGKKYSIKAVPKKTEPNIYSLFGIYKDQKNPLIRTVVIPKSYNGNGLKYINDWYLKRVDSRRGLNAAAVSKIDELTKGIKDPKEITKILYNYVHNQFKYVMVEIGMGAFIPSHTNEVFLNKEGDCKDLSNFLSEALNYKGIQCDLALAATFHHISDCDFPSLGSANHVVCVAYIDGKPIILDPTDSVHYMESPVESIQHRSILITNPEGGKWHKVKTYSNQENLIEYNIGLKAKSDQMLMEGDFEVSYHGISGNFIKRQNLYLNDADEVSFTKKHFESVFGNQDISSLKVSSSNNALDVKGILTINSRIFNDADKQILILDFLPRLIETLDTDALIEGTHLGTNYKKVVNLSIEMDKAFENFEPVSFHRDHNGVALDLTISMQSETHIECTYQFSLDHNSIEASNLESIKATINSFNTTINDPLLLKNKS